jgi:hypothetical protein
MSAFTETLRLQWLLKNGYSGPRGGMGAVAPMGTLRPSVVTDFAGIAVMRPRPSSRPDQPVSFTFK